MSDWGSRCKSRDRRGRAARDREPGRHRPPHQPGLWRWRQQRRELHERLRPAFQPDGARAPSTASRCSTPARPEPLGRRRRSTARSPPAGTTSSRRRRDGRNDAAADAGRDRDDRDERDKRQGRARSSTTALTGSCPTATDLVGYGTANCFEGAAATPALSNTTAALRGDGGCADTDQNGADFATAHRPRGTRPRPLTPVARPPPRPAGSPPRTAQPRVTPSCSRSR